MKKLLSRILILLIIIISLTEFVFANPVFAISPETLEVINTVTEVIGGVVSIVYWPKRILITGIAFVAKEVMTVLSKMDGVTDSYNSLTPFEIFFNKPKIVDVNFFDISGLPTDSTTYIIRTNVAKWFFIMRNIAATILLIILIYIGIRMLLASVADDKAKYKKMFVDWLASVALLFLLQFIAIAVVYANSAIVNALANYTAATDVDDVFSDMAWEAITGVGITSLTSTVVYALMVFQIIGYFIAYLNRMIKVAFLLIISPLITITYSIDKIADQKSQAFNNWLKEYIYTILIQPFHCLIYIAFISVAFGLIKNPSVNAGGLSWGSNYNQLTCAVLAILCIKFIKEAEDMIRTIFNFKDNNKGISLAAGLAASAYMAGKVGSMGRGARKFVNSASNNKFLKAVSSDVKNSKAFNKVTQKMGDLKNKVKDSGFGKKIADASAKSKALSKSIGDKLSKNKTISGFKKGMEAGKKYFAKGKDLWNSKPMKFIRGRNSLASALGIAAGLAHFAQNDSSPFTSIAAGNEAYKSADAFLTSSASTLGKSVSEHAKKKKENAQKELPELNKKKEDLEKNIQEAKEDLESSKEELEEQKQELEEKDEQVNESDKEVSDSNNRIQEYKDNGFYEQQAYEMSQRNALIAKNNKLKKEREELSNNVSAKQIEVNNKEEALEEMEKELAIQNKEIEEVEKELQVGDDLEATQGFIAKILTEGDSGKFNKSKSKEYTRIIADLEKTLQKMDLDGNTERLATAIEQGIAANGKDFNLEKTMERVLGNNITQHEEFGELERASRKLQDFEHDSNMYKDLKLGTDLELSLEKFSSVINKEM